MPLRQVLKWSIAFSYTHTYQSSFNPPVILLQSSSSIPPPILLQSSSDPLPNLLRSPSSLLQSSSSLPPWKSTKINEHLRKSWKIYEVLWNIMKYMKILLQSSSNPPTILLQSSSNPFPINENRPHRYPSLESSGLGGNRESTTTRKPICYPEPLCFVLSRKPI